MEAARRNKERTVKGGALIARMLAAEGVEKVFGIIDGTYLALYANFESNGIELITPRHETNAAHMAGAYARLTGRLGVCIASNGPGVANVLPGVVVEQAEGNRVLLLTSCRREGIAYPDRGGAYQYFPQVEVTRAFAKWSCAVPSAERLPEIMRRAFRELYTGRPGVVHVDVPESIVNGEMALASDALREPGSYRVLTPLEPSAEAVSEAARWLIEADAPVIHAGSGIIHARAFKPLAELATLIQAPVTTSWAARAAMDERSELAVSMQYLDAVNSARKEADLVLTLGSRLGETDWWGKAPYWGSAKAQRMIQVDIDPATIGCNKPADLAIHADVGRFLERVIEELSRRGTGTKLEARRKRLASLQKMVQSRRKALHEKLKDHSAPMMSPHVPVICREIFPDDAILVVDGGNTAIWSHFYHQVREPNTVLQTAKMGMLGAGVSQALAAKVAYPERQVYCIIGDGAMGFQPQEIETAVRNKLAVIYLVLSDKQWGMVKMTQQFAFKPLKTLVFKSLGPDETINADLGEIEWDQLARSMGAYGERVADPSGLEGAIARARASGQCAVIHVDVDPVKHLWAPNLKTFKDMHLEPKGE